MTDRERWLTSLLDSIQQDVVARKTGVLPEAVTLRLPSDMTRADVQAWLKEVRGDVIGIESGIVGKITFKMEA